MVLHTPAEAILSDIINEQANHKSFGVDLSVFNSGIMISLVTVLGSLVLLKLHTRRELAKVSQSFAKLGITAALINTPEGQNLALLRQ